MNRQDEKNLSEQGLLLTSKLSDEIKAAQEQAYLLGLQRGMSIVVREKVSDKDIFCVAERFGAFQYGDAQGGKTIAFARAVLALAMANKSGPDLMQNANVESVGPAVELPSHIKYPYTLDEIKAKLASHDYSAEMLLEHAMLLIDKMTAAPVQSAAPADVRCEGCGYMTHHREHIGCVRAAKQNQPAAPVGELPPLPYAHCFTHDGTDYFTAHQMAVYARAALAAQPALAWIPCSERMPPSCHTVLAVIRGLEKPIYIGTRPEECVEDDEITHWMPLPAAPGGKHE